MISYVHKFPYHGSSPSFSLVNSNTELSMAETPKLHLIQDPLMLNWAGEGWQCCNWAGSKCIHPMQWICKHSLCSRAGSKYVHLKLHGTPKLLLRLFPSGKSSRVTVIFKKFWNLHRKNKHRCNKLGQNHANLVLYVVFAIFILFYMSSLII